MKTSRYTEPQILAILRQTEGGMPVAELCRAHGMTPLPGNGLLCKPREGTPRSISGGRSMGAWMRQ